MDDWPPYHPKHYTPLTIIHHEGRPTESEIITVAKEFSSNRITENIETQTRIDYDRSIKNINDLFTPYESETSHSYRILIEGAPGVGKTILSKEIAFQWANSTLLNSKSLLFLLFMRDPQVKLIIDVMTLVRYFLQTDTLANKIADWLAETDGKYLTIVLDGYDEVSEDNTSHFIKGVINCKWLKKCGLVITSRPSASSDLHDMVDCRAEVLGFTEENRKDFIKSAFNDQEHKIKELENFLLSSPFLNALCYIPLIMSILLCLSKDGIDTLPETQTRLFEKFIIMTIIHFLKKSKKVTTSNIVSFNDLPHPYGQVVKELSQFAFLALQRNQLVFTVAEVKATCPNLTPANWYGLGLLKPAKYFKSQGGYDHESFHFLHFSIQEYMAAYHITSLPANVQLKLLNETFWNVRYYNTWIMYAGITSGNNFVFKHFLTGNYFQISSWLFGADKISNSILNDKIKCLHLLHCLGEADHKMLLSVVEPVFQGGIIDLSNRWLSPTDVRALAVLLLTSPNKQWDMINLSDCKIYDKTCNYFCENFHSQNVTLNVKTVDISCNYIHYDSLKRLSGLLRSWNTKKIIISINTLYDLNIANFISGYTSNVLKVNVEKIPANRLLCGILLVTYVHDQNRTIIVCSDPYRICCCQFTNCQLCDEKVINYIRKHFNTHIAISYTIPNTLLLDDFQHIGVCGFNLLSKTVYLRREGLKIEFLHTISSPHQYVADYTTAVVCHSYHSNKSYLRTLSKQEADTIQSLTSLTVFDVSNNNIGSEAADDIAVVLCSNTKLQKLYIQENNLETSGAINIVQGLQNTLSLTELNISSNNIGSEAADDIATVLSHNTKLQMLYLQENNLETSGAIKIARGLQNAKYLTEFNISSNNISSEAADDVATVLSHNTKLQMLYLQENNLETSGAIKIARGLQNAKYLTEFNISSNNIGSEAADDIAAALCHNTKLRKFYIWKNNLETSGAIKIARGLQSTKSLTEFNISSNNIGNEAADDIAAVLSHNTKLQKFYVGGNNLETSGAIKIARGLQNTSSLTVLNISSNNIGSEAADDIATFLSHNTKLQMLYLQENNLETSGAIKIARGLQNAKYLTEFNISSNNIGSEAADDIAVVLSHNSILKRFDWK